MTLSANLAAVLYTVSGVLFILALRGLSSPETSRRGNIFGMVGIAISIVTTLLVAGMGQTALVLIGGGLAVGGIIGALIAKKIPMTDMPQLIAAFHSLVGMAAVLVAVAAFSRPIASASRPLMGLSRLACLNCLWAQRSVRLLSPGQLSPSLSLTAICPARLSCCPDGTSSTSRWL